MEELENIIVLNDEEGNEVKFEFLDLVELDEEGTLKEIARIASGKITEVSINHARELRNLSFKEIA